MKRVRVHLLSTFGDITATFITLLGSVLPPKNSSSVVNLPFLTERAEDYR